VETLHGDRRTHRGVVEGEEPEATTQVQHAALRRQVLPDLVEEALAQDPEAAPAVRPHDRVVVRPDDATNCVVSHRCGTRGARAADRRRGPGTPAGAESSRAGRRLEPGSSPRGCGGGAG